MDGPTVLVGHSYSGMIVPQAGVDPKVTALVYIAARAPNAGEDYTALANRFPTPPASAGLIEAADGYAQLSEEAFLQDFAQDVDPARAQVLYSVQGRGGVPRAVQRESDTGSLGPHCRSRRGMTNLCAVASKLSRCWGICQPRKVTPGVPICTTVQFSDPPRR